MNFSEVKEFISNKISKMAPVRLIVNSFLLIIFLGTVILAMPFSSKDAPLSIIDAAFTATSATCVTGLSLFDTFTKFTFVGQLTILILIQVGGLGLATFTTAFFLLFRRKIGYKNLFLFSEASGGSGLDIASLLKIVLAMTFCCEFIGAALLMIRFVPLYGMQGAWSAIFVSISAFCNAGFDILGFIPGNSSASAFAGDAFVSFTISALIFIGSLGFLVLQDIYVNKFMNMVRRKETTRLSFHSHICIKVSLVLLVVGAVFFFCFEYNNTLSDFSFFEKIIVSVFQSVNTRTAGFASINIGAENDITKLLTIILMFIGGSPGSTAGGIKVTTFIIIIATVLSTLRSNDNVNFLNHRIERKTVYKAITVIFLGVVIIFIDLLILLFFNHFDSTLDTLFEVVSAFATVGLSAGVTAELNFVGKLAIILTMFVGRVGPVSFGLAILLKPRKPGETILPEGRILIG